MRSSASLLFSLVATTGGALAVPAPVDAAAPAPVVHADNVELERRQLLGGLVGSLVGSINSSLSSGNTNNVLSALKSVSPTATPTSPSQAIGQLQNVVETGKPSNIWEYSTLLGSNGLISGTLDSLVTGIGGELTAENSNTNNNRNPPKSVYPKKASCDAPYDVSESALRSAIYIPPSFTYGKKPPVILFPGTGNTGYETFAGNMIPLLTGASWADPVWVNVPNQLLGDAQVNAEYAAYAINYIASLTKQNVTILAWSQGNINTQWAFKYWPSTRKVTSNHIAVSPDYKGTIEADFICPPGLDQCNPSVYQQEYYSKYITALRANNGDSAYVPTTTIYSGFFDEIVEPQQGTGASAYLNDARKVGVTNNEVQTVCAGEAAGTFYTHEGVLYNPLSFALLQDAMTHGGPGQISRLPSLSTTCSQYLTPGLDLGDLLVTENSILIAGLGVLVGQPRATAEPALKSYASGTGASC